METEKRMLFARGWRKEKMQSYCLMGMEFHFGKMRVLEMHGGDGCTMVGMY